MLERNGLLYWTLLGGALLWFFLPAAPPLLAHFGQSGPADLLALCWSGACHQIDERCFHFWGEPTAVCSRCWGLYGGLPLGLLLLPEFRGLQKLLLRHPRAILFFPLPLAVDWLAPFDAAWSRFLTGVLATFPFGLFLWLGLQDAPGALAALLTKVREESR